MTLGYFLVQQFSSVQHPSYRVPLIYFFASEYISFDRIVPAPVVFSRTFNGTLNVLFLSTFSVIVS
uniref:Uncharacterized protein n=1 Tax=Arundo donax TaxID=35708 RepID=A0A0A9B426_ARUDO